MSKSRRPDGTKSQYLNPDFTPSNVFKMADETGGDALKADRVDQAFPQIVERIRTRYSLTYQAPTGKPGEFREIRVELIPAAQARNPGSQLRSRRGYFMQ